MRITKTFQDAKERVHIIKDDQILLTVAPWYGAKLTQVKLQKDGTYHDVLWHVSDEDLESNNWFQQSILFPYPNRLEDGKYTFEGKDYQWPINQPETNNQLHGMVFNHPFEVERADASEEEAIITLIRKYDGSEAYYPFPYDLKVTYRYFGSGLETVFEITNTGSSNMPFGIGWHPYFQIDGEGVAGYTFKANKLESLELSDRSLPTGKREEVNDPTFKLSEHILDNAYQLMSKPNIYQLETSKGHTLKFEVSDSMEYLQLFTPPGGETIAIEPMTCNVNAFNDHGGVRTLAAKNNFECAAIIRFT